MKYNFIKTNNIIEDYLKKHNLDLLKYNEEYDFNINEEAINVFYDKLIQNKDLRFLIVGDYDCDGICSVAIIKNLFENLNIEHNYYIPSRLKEGYGLNKLIVDNAIKYKFNALLLVDNGVSCKEAIQYAYDNNIKVFIIDHHKFEDKPTCEAFLHQDLLDKEYCYSSAGELCFLLSLKCYFDEYNLVLAGLTILSDYILINSFNRFILKEMLTYLNDFDYEPLVLLNEGSIFSGSSLTFNIIPKINSVSRMETKEFNANHVVKFLLSKTTDLSKIAKFMSDLNNVRKKETNNIFNDVISKQYEEKYVFICSKDINEGYCSSLATKLSNYYDKTVFVLSDVDGVCKGSCRSQNLDIHSLLKDYPKYLSFGGHEHAVGLNILSSDVSDFVNYLNRLDFTVINEKEEDVYIFDPEYINDKLFSDINSLGPFGNGYESPIIGVSNNNFHTNVIKNKYTKFIINNNLSAITFDEKYLGYNPQYIFGSLNKDSYNIGAYSIIIKGLF